MKIKMLIKLISTLILVLTFVSCVSGRNPTSNLDFELISFEITTHHQEVVLSWDLVDPGTIRGFEILTTTKKIGQGRKPLQPLVALGSDSREYRFLEEGLSDLIVCLKVHFNNGDPTFKIEGRTIVDKERFDVYQIDNRLIYVYLPPGYHDEPDLEYPLLVMQDGQQLFSTGTAGPSGEWRVDETLDRLISNKLSNPMIVAGISSGTDRVSAFWPRKFGYQEGKGEEYAAWIMNEIVPLLEENYSITQERSLRGVMGSSYGAAISLFLGLEYPEEIGFLGLVSPAMDLGGQEEIPKIDLPPELVWIDSGAQEIYQIIAPGLFHFPENAQLLFEQFQNKGLGGEGDLVLYIQEGIDNHREDVVAERLENPLMLFGNPIKENFRVDSDHLIWQNQYDQEISIQYTNY